GISPKILRPPRKVSGTPISFLRQHSASRTYYIDCVHQLPIFNFSEKPSDPFVAGSLKSGGGTIPPTGQPTDSKCSATSCEPGCFRWTILWLVTLPSLPTVSGICPKLWSSLGGRATSAFISLNLPHSDKRAAFSSIPFVP